MHILIHDFAGYSFPTQLSRGLARIGHRVTHVYPDGLPGPKGRLSRALDDPANFKVHAIPLSGGFSKYSPVKRFISQRKYARDLKAFITTENPDVVLSGDTPIDIQAELLWQCRLNGIGFVHWVQDVYYRAIRFFIQKRIGAVAGLLSFPFKMLEKHIARKSDSNIVIAQEFGDLLTEWGVTGYRISVLENWAPLDEIETLEKDNDWSRAHDLTGKTVFLYSGTLGLKHRPDLLYRLAECLDDTCKVVVVTEGLGRKYLESMPSLSNLLLLDFQPYKELSKVLASADVLLAMLESDAGGFAVPSKILSYLCAGRPILLAAPETNLAASIVKRSAAGFVASPEALDTWTAAAKLLATDSTLRLAMGNNARQYANRTFNIQTIVAAFEKVLAGAARPLASPGHESPATQGYVRTGSSESAVVGAEKALLG